MLWTWDRYGTDTTHWRRVAQDARHHEHPLSRFLTIVDHLLFAAALAFVICVGVLVFG